MRKRIISYCKYYSNFIFPALVFVVCYFIQNKVDVFSLDDEKMSMIVSLASSFIGVLLTILTIYLAVPKNEVKIKLLKESKHQYIYLVNLLTGIALSFLTILIWIFFDSSYIACVSFLASISNIAITIYYTFSIIKIMET